MPDHAPLTKSQIDLANKIAAQPIRMTSGEFCANTGMGHDANFLMNAGFLSAELVFIAQESRDSIMLIKRTAKPINS